METNFLMFNLLIYFTLFPRSSLALCKGSIILKETREHSYRSLPTHQVPARQSPSLVLSHTSTSRQGSYPARHLWRRYAEWFSTLLQS